VTPAQTPGWADEPEPPPAARTATATPPPDLGPAILDLDFGGPIEHGVPTVVDLPGEAPPSWFASLGLLTGAAAALVLGTFGLGLALMLRDLFAASPVLGWLGAALGAGAGGAVLLALGREWRALSRLKALDALAQELRTTPGTAKPPAALLQWAQDVAKRVPEAVPPVAQMMRATTLDEARGLMAAGLLPLLDARVKALGWQSARQVFVVTAVLPSPAMDAAAMALLGLRLMRQVAVLHGMRPGTAMLWRLLRRLGVSAGLAAGTDLAVEAGVEQFFAGHAARLAGGAAGATVAARRMLRLAGITAAACRPGVGRDGRPGGDSRR
jgi:putative membrane protein